MAFSCCQQIDAADAPPHVCHLAPKFTFSNLSLQILTMSALHQVHIDLGSHCNKVGHTRAASNLRHVKAASQQHIPCIAHEVQEGAVRSLVDFEAAGLALALGGAGDAAALVVHHKGVQLAVPLPGHCLLEVLGQAVHQILRNHYKCNVASIVLLSHVCCKVGDCCSRGCAYEQLKMSSREGAAEQQIISC